MSRVSDLPDGPRATYLDAASVAPLHPAARAALLAALDDGWADPARLYREGRRARMLLDAARETVAAGLGARADEVTFCASGTEAIHLGVLGTLRARQRVGRQVVVSAVEHSAVLHAAETGGEMTTIPVDRLGRVDAGTYAAALRADTALACLQSANHEVGTVQPVEEVAEACRAQGVPLLVDAGQSAGRVPLPTGWSVLTASAHKWGGPPGVGVLAVRTGVRWRSPRPADEREPGRDLPAIVAAAAALQARAGEAAEEAARLSAYVDRIRTEIARGVPDVEVVGDPVHRLPHLVTFSCLYVEGEALLTELDRAGFSVSSGSSCTSSTLSPSHVLEAMGVLSHGNVRVSLHGGVSEDDVARFLATVPQIVARLRRTAGAEQL